MVLNEIFTVSQLTEAIKRQLETKFSFVSVRGEISNLREQSSGHLYFTLKDKEAQISAVLFKGAARHLSHLPKEGDQVILKGELNVYPPRGNYQIIVREMEHAGTGHLLQKLHALKTKLQQLGWFDPKLKKPLPKLPRTIGVITSPTGAVIQDILHILSRRFSGFHLVLNPVRVQGEEAAKEIARAIEEFNKYNLADVLIVGRGGGSLEDLWPFNEEIVAQAIKDSKIPIISAVGHETDFCISDFVADVRAPTPSAAAEIVILEKNEQLFFLEKMKKRLHQTTFLLLRAYKEQLKAIVKQPLLSTFPPFLTVCAQKIDGIQQDLNDSITNLIYRKRVTLFALQKQKEALKPTNQLRKELQIIQKWETHLLMQIKQLLAQKKSSFNQLISHLKSIDPRNLLTKGYAILFRENRSSVILSANEVAVSEKLRLQLHDGQLIITVNQKEVS